MSGKSPQRNTLGTKIGEGSYGCVYATNDKKKVLKVSDIKEASIELNIAKVIKGIPDWEKYYVIQNEENFGQSNFKRIRPLYEGNCKIIREKSNSNLRLISSPYGGISVRNIEITESFSYYKAMRHILEAVAKLNAQGICHFDLHSGNILEDINGLIRLIDFGAAFMGDEADINTVKKRSYTFSPKFAAQPPELSIQNAIMEGKPIQESIDDLLEKREVFRNSVEYTGLTPSYVRNELFNFSTDEYHTTVLAWSEYYRKYWRKWDVWGVGILALKILQQCLFIKVLRNELWDDIQMRSKIQKLLQGCLEPDPRKRFSAKDALHFWISSS
jgi:serine/threonine protein kinase